MATARGLRRRPDVPRRAKVARSVLVEASRTDPALLERLLERLLGRDSAGDGLAAH